MRKSIRLSVAATVYMLIFLSSQGMAMSQERSRVIDTGVIFSAQQVERSPNVDWVKLWALRPRFGRPLSKTLRCRLSECFCRLA